MLWLALFAWLALRLLLLLMEVVQRPLYPWDAWTQWSTKARVFYELRTIVPFVGASQWFASSGGVYFDAAPHYPATVPLTQVWSATLLGAWNDSLINLPWWLTAVAFGLTLYGFLRLQRMSTLFALTGAWLALSLPMFDTHVALAGYADLAMSTYFTLTVLAHALAVPNFRRRAPAHHSPEHRSPRIRCRRVRGARGVAAHCLRLCAAHENGARHWLVQRGRKTGAQLL